MLKPEVQNVVESADFLLFGVVLPWSKSYKTSVHPCCDGQVMVDSGLPGDTSYQ